MKKRTNLIFLAVAFLGTVLILYEPVMNMIIAREVQRSYDTELTINDVIEMDEYTYTPQYREDVRTIEEQLKDIDDTTPIDTMYDMDSRQLPVGRVSIPSVNLNMTIFKGLGQENGDAMLRGAATNKIGQEMGKRNYVISSHASSNPNVLFSPLYRVDVGEKVYLTDDNTVYEYTITETNHSLDPERVDILDDIEGKRTITLYTCTQDGTQRVAVFGELTDTFSADSEQNNIFN